MKEKLVLAGVVALIVLPTVLAVAQADVPAGPEGGLIPYEGTLNTDGEPAGGDYDFRFAIYGDIDPASTPVWSEVHGSISVVGGRFSVVLGEGQTESGAIEAVWNLDQMYLGIELCETSVTETPCEFVPLDGRQRILSVPKATHAAAAGSLGQIISMSTLVPPPDPRFWLLCDGRAIPPESRLGRYLVEQGNAAPTSPDLTDDRFLMGGPADGTDDRGGHNDGHGHGFSLATGNPNAGSGLASHTHGYSLTTYRSEPIEAQSEVARNIVTGTGGRTTGGPSNVNHTHPVAGTIGSNLADGDAAGSNRPKYQKVNFYMKIN